LEADIDPEKSWMKDFEANAQTYFYAALAIAAVILGISSLTAFEVNRQLRRQASQLTSLAVLAHELKTPIASSRILLEGLALRDKPSLETIRDYTGLLLDENERLGRTVQNLLAFAKFERDPSAFRPTTLNLSATVRESLAQVRHRLVEPDTLLREELPIEDSHVNADARMVEHALGNLLDNAVKHTPAPRRVSVTLYETAQSVELAVSDDGPGIPKAKQQEIFEPFRQGNDRLDRTSEGCGLGLAIVREVMRLHRGRVDLVSTSGGGSRFVLHFPKS